LTTSNPGDGVKVDIDKILDENIRVNIERELEHRRGAECWHLKTNLLGLPKGASRDRLSFATNMTEALSEADLVEENAPERPDFKIKLYAEMDEVVPVDSLLASSSSGITPSFIQSQCKYPERVVIGHPFNPPHIIPLVEVVGGS
jgi:3-hydroxyacyl-CoA dehydrogenase